MFLVYDITILIYPMIVGNGSIAILLIVMAGQKYYYTNQVVPPYVDNTSDTSEKKV